MELKNYQKKVLKDLNSYLEFLGESGDVIRAYQMHWNSNDILVGFGGVQPYKKTIDGAPSVCFKVPTGGGKTFLACASVKPIFEAMSINRPKVVAWLVPSNAILEQTIRNLSNPQHPYRQRLDFDFQGRVMVYTKEQLLNGQNFNPSAVQDQLSICVLSYDSLRSNKKDGRKVYQENSQLASFTKLYSSHETLIENVDDTALIQVINQLSPVVIVDESHNAHSDLSVEMINNLSPIFVLDFTATPKNNSNIISYVDARDLKKENMVKLPVVVYNRSSKLDVIVDAMHLRASIERQALTEEAGGGNYIRPIVLFQAQPKGKEDSSTFEKLKNELVGLGISPEEIAIKTSDINELKGIDLLRKDCKIRYIITVNALKEGWDCPFAYILATLANKTSKVDVEQIVGRVLRQPYAKKHGQPLLNNSYVLTCSNDFWSTLDSIIAGLNSAGFSKRDVRVASETAKLPETTLPENEVAPTLESTPLHGEPQEGNFEQPEEFLDVDFTQIKEMLNAAELSKDQSGLTPAIEVMITEAERQSSEYEEAVEQSDSLGLIGGQLGGMMNQYKIQEEFIEAVRNFQIPQFFFETAPNLFHENFELLSKENLSEGFTLRNEDSKVSFELSSGEVYSVDVAQTGDAVPKYQRMTKTDSKYIRDHLASLPSDVRIKTCSEMICQQLNKIDTIETGDIRAYVARIVANMNTDELSALETAVPIYAQKIKGKIDSLELIYREKQFSQMVDTGEINCRPNYKFPSVITPINITGSLVKSLYESEAYLNGFERDAITAVASLNNVVWWHKIIERKGLCINGFINHYPDFAVMTTKGNLVLIETKGDHLANDESSSKLKLGRAWADHSGSQYKYFMVFLDKDLKLDGAYVLDEFIEVMKRL